MKQQACLIAVDLGTTAVKVMAVSFEGNILTETQAKYPLDHPRSGIYEQDPDQIFQATLRSLQRILSELEQTEVRGISFSSAMHSLIAVDPLGKPLSPSIIWADSRSEDEAEALKPTKLGKYIYQQTGTPIHPMSPLCKLIWMQKNKPRLLQQTYKFLGIKEYILYKLSGEWVVDHSIASATGLFNIFKKNWEPKALELTGVRLEQLPTPIPTFYILKNIHPDLPAKLPLIVGASDGCLANIGSGGIICGDATVTIGTSGAIRVLANSPKIDQSMRLFTYILDEDHYIEGGPINNGGKVLDWYYKGFLEEVPDLGLYLESVFEEVQPGAGGLLCLPYLMGERAPIWDANTRGVFLGVRSGHTKKHFVRAIMEGVIFSLLQIGEALEETHIDYETIYAGGGFARSTGWVQMLADIFQHKVILSGTIQQSGMGAIALGMRALGEIKAYGDFPFSRINEKVFTPNTKTHETYNVHYGVFKGLYHKLKEDFHTLIEFQQEKDY
ncbi:MAG: gluconokinase [Bacteroidota bacterium]